MVRPSGTLVRNIIITIPSGTWVVEHGNCCEAFGCLDRPGGKSRGQSENKKGEGYDPG